MIFKAEVNPRDHKGHYEMICHLQTECLRRHGAGFDVTKFAMGQLTPNSDMCWFEGFVDDEDIHQANKKKDFDRHVEEAIKFLTVNGFQIISQDQRNNDEVFIKVESSGNISVQCNNPETYSKIRRVEEEIVNLLLRAIIDSNK